MLYVRHESEQLSRQSIHAMARRLKHWNGIYLVQFNYPVDLGNNGFVLVLSKYHRRPLIEVRNTRIQYSGGSLTLADVDISTHWQHALCDAVSTTSR